MKFLMFISLCLAVTTSYASYIGKGTVDEIQYGPVYKNLVYINIDGQQNNKPYCSVNKSFNYVVDVSTDIGKTVFSGLLAAYASQSEVAISGYGNCGLSSEVESLRWFSVK